jgi:hypothetical protein
LHARIRLIHWNVAEAADKARRLQAGGYEVEAGPLAPGRPWRRDLAADLPDAIVIDLSRLPSQGRDVALSLRLYKPTRQVPLVFVDGDNEKVAAIRVHLPDAVYANWENIGEALEWALAYRPTAPVVPASVFAPYEFRPLAGKLGIKANTAVGLVDAPEDFEATLSGLPEGVSVQRQAGGRRDMTIWFVRSRRDLDACVERMAPMDYSERLWIAWPKKGSALASDLSQPVVRHAGLAAGLVDFKVCAIDAMWTALQFVRRKPK